MLSDKSKVALILLIEDNPGDATLIRQSLGNVPNFVFELIQTDRLESAFEKIRATPVDAPFDVLLLDLSLPDSEGLETIGRAADVAPNTPIVVLSGADESMGMEAVRLGAQDYLIKGQANGALIVRAIRYATERKRMEVELRQARDLLELRVQQRTAELENAITVLGDEVGDRNEAERELRDSEERFRQMVEAMPEAVWIVSCDMDSVHYVNSTFERVWGQPRENYYRDAEMWLKSIHPEDRDGVLARRQKWLKSGDAQDAVAFRVVRPDGAVVAVSGRELAIRDQRGSLVRICGLVREESPAASPAGVWVSQPAQVSQ